MENMLQLMKKHNKMLKAGDANYNDNVTSPPITAFWNMIV